MPESKNTAWLHGPPPLGPAALSDCMASLDGLLPARAVLDLEVGEEIVLCLRDSTPFINTLAKTRPFNLRVHGGAARNEFGCLGYFVFWIPSPFSQDVPLAIYDLYVNPQNEPLLGAWRELAFQTHWDIQLLDRKNEHRGSFEFANTFRIQELLEKMHQFCRGNEVLDFDKAKAQFMAEKSLEDLFETGPMASTNSESGLSDRAGWEEASWHRG